MSVSVRRMRGAMLRLVRRRAPALLVGLLLMAPAAWGQLGPGYSAGWMDGVSLLLGATGLALAWTSIAGLRPDWTE